MLIIKTLNNIVCAKLERGLPESLVAFLERTLSELHEALEPETDFDQFSLEMYGPIYVLESGLDNCTSLSKLGLFPNESGMVSYQPEWAEKNDIGDHLHWRVGVMTDNDYLFQVILPVNEFGPEVEQWLEELSS